LIGDDLNHALKAIEIKKEYLKNTKEIGNFFFFMLKRMLRKL
jgi:hypothetical protein